MRKIWLVASRTYRERIRSTSFLLLTFAIPLLMVIAGAIPILSELRGKLAPVGYVDQTGELAPVESVPVGDERLQVIPFTDVSAAQQAVRSGKVLGYLLVPEGYFEGEASATFYGERSPNSRVETGLAIFMRSAMRPDAAPWKLERLEDPSEVTYVALETGERVRQGPALIVRVATPAVLALIFVLSVFTSASQMGATVVREKEQRAMEIVVTSLSPRQLVVGKVMGMTLASLTQIGVWVASAVLAVALSLSGSLRIQDLSIPWSAFLWAALLGIPGYFLYAVVGAGLGVIAGDKQQARQLAGMLGFLGMGPLYFMSIIIDNLDGALGVGLTLFPLTAPTIALFRMTLTDVPTWQLGGSFAIIVVFLAASIWFVARIFRAAMLMYGQALTPQEILRTLREA